MKTKNTTLLALSLLAPLAFAQTERFTWETQVDYTTREIDADEFEFDEDNIHIGARLFLSDAFKAGVPFAEMPFLSQATWLSANADIRRLDDDINDAADIDSYDVKYRAVSRETNWYAELAYVNTTTSGTSSIFASRLQPEYDGYAIEVGHYLNEATSLGLAFSKVDYENISSESTIESGSDTIGLTFKHYARISDTSGVSFEANYYFVDTQVADFDDLDDNAFESSGDVYSFNAIYYPTHAVGIGLSYADADDLGGRPYINSSTSLYDGIALFAEWYATERLSLKASYNNAEYDLSDADNFEDPGDVEADSLTVSVGYRF